MKVRFTHLLTAGRGVIALDSKGRLWEGWPSTLRNGVWNQPDDRPLELQWGQIEMPNEPEEN